jgi:hypothetical protein
MDDIKVISRRHRMGDAFRSIGRHRRVLLMRAAYGAATATGTTAVGLIVVAFRHLL